MHILLFNYFCSLLWTFLPKNTLELSLYSTWQYLMLVIYSIVIKCKKLLTPSFDSRTLRSLGLFPCMLFYTKQHRYIHCRRTRTMLQCSVQQCNTVTTAICVLNVLSVSNDWATEPPDGLWVETVLEADRSDGRWIRYSGLLEGF